MSQKKDIAFLLHPNDYKEISLNNITLANPIDVYILSRLDFNTPPNISSEEILLNFSSYVKNILLNNDIQKNSSPNEIMNLKKNNIDIFIVSKEYFIKNKISQINTIPSTVQLIETQGKKVLYFPNDIISFIIIKMQNAPSLINNQHNTNQNINPISNIINNNFVFNNNIFNNISDNNNIIFPENDPNNFSQNNMINNNNIINTFEQQNPFMNLNNASPNEDSKLKIIQILILLYANEREVTNLFVQGYITNPESNNLKDYYIVSKSLIDKFKQIYHYDLIHNILSIHNITNIKKALQNMKYYISLNEIKSHRNMINTDITSFSQLNLAPNTQTYGIYNFPINFVIIHKSIIKQIVNLIMNYFDDSYYNIQIGISSLFLKSTYDTKKIYIYKYNNNLFNIMAVFDFFNDIWKDIYNKYFSKITLEEYLNLKKIDINKKNQKQNLLNSENKLLGYIYLIPLSDQNGNITQNINDNEIINNINNLNINKNDNIKKSNFSPIYHKLINSINNLEPNYPDEIPDISAIINKISLKQLKGMTVHIIESSKLQYCIDTIKD